MSFKLSAIATGITLALFMSTAGTAMAYAPLGAVALCRQTPEICQSSGASTVEGSKTLLALIRSVNTQVNASIRFTAEARGADKWQVNPRNGDCEDYALSKRDALIKAGVPSNAMSIMVTLTRRGAGLHAVLVVKTNKGDFVLDNERRSVVTIAQGGYRVLAMSNGSMTRWL